MKKAKRVRFVDTENDDLANNGLNTSPGGGEAAQPRVFDAPKTSEYAFFKKIKKDAGRSYCRALPQEDSQLKTAKSHNLKSVGTSSLSDLLECREPDTEFSFRADEMGAVKQNFFVSPPKDTSGKVKQSSSRLSGNVAPFDQNVFFSPVASASVRSGNQYFGKGFFAGKRQKLHQLAADTLLPEIGKSCSKGFDLVSKLLGRLFPKGNENDDSEFVEGELHTNIQSPARPMSDVPEKKLNLIHRKRSRESKNESCWSDFTPTYSSSSAERILISEEDNPLASYDAKAIFQDGMENLNYVSDPEVIRSWCRRGDSSFCLPYEKYGNTGSFYIQELPEYYDLSEATTRGPHNLLLEWDFNRHKEKPDFYPPASGIEKHMYSTLRTSREVHNQKIVDDKLDESAFSRLSFFSQYSSEYNLFPHFHPTSFHTWDVRRGLEYDDSMHLEPGQFSSRLSCTPKYLTQAEECDTSNLLGGGTAIVSGQDHPLCISNVFDERQGHNFEALLVPRGLDIDLGWKCFSVTNLPGESQLPAYHAFHFPLKREICPYYLTEEEQDYSRTAEGAPSYQDYSFTNTFDRAMSRPLLLDSSCWDGSYLLDNDYKLDRC